MIYILQKTTTIDFFVSPPDSFLIEDDRKEGDGSPSSR
jgi:hypothetical protein